jgi:hypothetical protein
MKCPLCDTTLPDNATECTRCDWVKVEEKPVDVTDRTALVLSLVPGLGHLYKGHVWFGGLIFFIIGPAILALSLAVLPATLGVSIVIPIVFMGAMMVHAFLAPDVRKQTVAAMRAWDEGHAGGGH